MLYLLLVLWNFLFILRDVVLSEKNTHQNSHKDNCTVGIVELFGNVFDLEHINYIEGTADNASCSTDNIYEPSKVNPIFEAVSLMSGLWWRLLFLLGQGPLFNHTAPKFRPAYRISLG